MLPSIILGIHKIGVGNRRQKRRLFVRDVKPVHALEERAVRFEDKRLRMKMGDCQEIFGIVRRNRNEFERKRCGECYKDAVNGEGFSAIGNPE